MATRILLAPRCFFAGLEPHRSAGSALLFALSCYAVSYVLEGTVGRAVATVLVGSGVVTDGGAGGLAGLVVGLAPFLMGLFASAALVHLAARAFLTPELGLGASLRVACYASATELVAWLPIVGPMTIFYWILLMVLGLISLNASATALTEEEKNA